MSGRERIVVAMSGGVDSGVAAARLVTLGYEVVGVTLHLWDYPELETGEKGRCCAPEDQYDARRTADALGFAHYTFDRRELFTREVVTPFVDAYLRGDTPSPCTACNRGVKLGELFGLADRLGATKVATGHYARVVEEDGAAFIARGLDRQKDQSYFLYATPPELVRRLVFPLGESHKGEVRQEAVDRKLPGATKGESQELCFVGSQASYANFVEARADGRIRPGKILGPDGDVVGEHDGVHRFTIGQRKGLGVALGRPVFVAKIDGERGDVVLGEGDSLGSTTASLKNVHLAPNVTLPLQGVVRVRYRHDGARARIAVSDGEHSSPSEVQVSFDEPVRAVSRGQAAVIYAEDGERVLGGGILA